MKPNLPNWLFFGGICALGVSNTSKDLFPNTLGRFLPLHWGCAIVSAALFSVGLLFSLRGLFADSTRPSRFLLPLLCNLSFFALILGVYFMVVIFASKMYQFGSVSPFPDFLPKLINSTQTLDSAEKRMKAAQAAYEIYGVKLGYRDEAGNFVTYLPSPKDAASFAHQQQIDAQNRVLLAQLKSTMDQYPYLFSFYLGAFFITFVVGSLCFAFLRPSSAHGPQS